MKINKKIDINSIDEKTLIINLYLTQIITLSLSLAIYFLFLRINPYEILISVLPNKIIDDLQIALMFSALVVVVNIILSKVLPKEYLDDGGINEKLFSNLPLWHIAIISIVVGFNEELLFRGALQSIVGVIITSIIFTLIHFRYLNKIVLLIYTFLTGLGLGILAYYTEWFTAFLAHVIIDFILGVFIQKHYFVKY